MTLFPLFSDPTTTILVTIFIPISIITSPLFKKIFYFNKKKFDKENELEIQLEEVEKDEKLNKSNNNHLQKRKKLSQKNANSNDLNILESSNNNHKILSKSEILKFVIPYYFCILGDWLQGPYAYEIYASAGWSKEWISRFFVIGYLTSFLLGTTIGDIADRIGRKKTILIGYCFFYSISCIFIHKSYSLIYLVIGRILSGISASILSTIFESWILSNFQSDLSYIFYLVSFGGSCMAILSGILAYIGLIITKNRYSIAFDISFLCLVIGGILIGLLWKENIGEKKISKNQTFSSIKTIIRNKNIIQIAILQSAFESSLFVFVFNWSPTLTGKQTNNSTSLALIFCSFMVCIMIGSNLFSIFSRNNVSNSFIILLIFIFSIISQCIPIFSSDFTTTFIAFSIFEICSGLFWPTISSLKSQIIPKTGRSSIVNIIRMPTNIIIVFVVLYSGSFSESSTFTLICILLSIGLVTSITFHFSNYIRKKD